MAVAVWEETELDFGGCFIAVLREVRGAKIAVIWDEDSGRRWETPCGIGIMQKVLESDLHLQPSSVRLLQCPVTLVPSLNFSSLLVKWQKSYLLHGIVRIT